MARFSLTLVSALLAGGLLASANAQAGPMTAKLQRLLQEHNLMRSANEQMNAAKARVDIEKSGWYPDIAVTGDIGREKYDRTPGADTNLNTRSIGVSLTQQVYDFGALDASIQQSELSERLTKTEAERQSQRLILAGLEAEQQLRNALVSLDYAEESEHNIRDQTDLESTRIETGQGYATDLLQAKAQLAAAEARKVAAIGELEKARNRYQAVFGYDAPYPTTTESLTVPELMVPTSLKQAVDVAISNHVDLRVSRANIDVSRAEVRKLKKSEYMPRLDLVASLDNEHNPSGVDTDNTIAAVGLQFSWDYNLGGGADSTVAAASHTSAAAEQDYLYVERQVIEDIRNTWIQLQTSKDRVTHLENQARIAEQFLELARKERELGKRSLLDVLTGETSLINAKSETSSAKSEMVLAQIRLLLHIGRLDIHTF